MYSPVSVLTLIFVPSTTNWGTITVSPVSVFAGLNEPVAVALFRLGSVSVTVKHDARRQLHADRAVVVEVHLDVDVRDQVARLALEKIGGQGELLEALLVHEYVAAAVAVEILHLPLVDEGPLDLVLGADALVLLGARLDVLHLDLHEGAAAAADVHVVGFEHAPDALFPLDQVAGADFGCRYFRHLSRRFSEKGRKFTGFRQALSHRIRIGTLTGADGGKDPEVPRFSLECRLCPRLARHLDRVRAAHPGYHARPVAPFGAVRPRLLVVGLAPGMHGANRTGRPFTGDHAGILLYETLHRFGFASRPASIGPGDGLKLVGCRITNAVKCLPPAEQAAAGGGARAAIPTCAAEIAALPRGAAILALGRRSRTRRC